MNLRWLLKDRHPSSSWIFVCPIRLLCPYTWSSVFLRKNVSYCNLIESKTKQYGSRLYLFLPNRNSKLCVWLQVPQFVQYAPTILEFLHIVSHTDIFMLSETHRTSTPVISVHMLCRVLLRQHSIYSMFSFFFQYQEPVWFFIYRRKPVLVHPWTTVTNLKIIQMKLKLDKFPGMLAIIQFRNLCLHTRFLKAWVLKYTRF
jgi:hypothetical protein